MTTAVTEEELPHGDAQHCRAVLLQPPTSSQDEPILQPPSSSPDEPILQPPTSSPDQPILQPTGLDQLLHSPDPLQRPHDLQGTCHALNLGKAAVEEQVHRFNENNLLHTSMHTYGNVRLHSTDTKYPEALSTEESPRRRARSLPWNSIPEVEEEEDSLMCCCKLKKKVKFADALGLTLANVKHFMPSDEPFVPKAVLARLQSYPPTVCIQRSQIDDQEEIYDPQCVPPSITPAELLTRLGEQGVCLEKVSLSTWGVRGCVLVKDPEEKAQVKIRYTFNEWLSFLDCCAVAAEESVPFPVPESRRFIFNLNYPPSTSRIHFAICFSTGNGQEFWDNNKGVNYTVSFQQEHVPEIQSLSPEQEEWGGPQLW